jgi:hypothetical protein
VRRDKEVHLRQAPQMTEDWVGSTGLELYISG